MKTQPNLTLCEVADPGLEGVESYSPFCLKVHRALKLAGLRYERRHGTRPDEFKSLNPTGQVPVLLVGEEPVYDSSAILRRIDQLSPGRLLPQGTNAAEAWLWEELGDTALNGFLVASRWADEENFARLRAAYFGAMPWPVRSVLPGILRKKVVGALVARDVWRAGPEACWKRFELLLDSLDARAPERGFWLGDAPSVADLGLFGQLWSLRTPLTPRQDEAVSKRFRLTAWLNRVDRETRAASTPRIVPRVAAA